MTSGEQEREPTRAGLVTESKRLQTQCTGPPAVGSSPVFGLPFLLWSAMPRPDNVRGYERTLAVGSHLHAHRTELGDRVEPRLFLFMYSPLPSLSRLVFPSLSSLPSFFSSFLFSSFCFFIPTSRLCNSRQLSDKTFHSFLFLPFFYFTSLVLLTSRLDIQFIFRSRKSTIRKSLEEPP